MNDSGHLGVGLHVCRNIERTDDGNLAGVDCDLETYDVLDDFFVAVIGRSPEVGERVIKWYLNGSIVDKVDCGEGYHIIYTYKLDERHIGTFRIEYVENKCIYWAKTFTKGVCPTAIVRPQLEISRLVDLLRKFRV